MEYVENCSRTNRNAVGLDEHQARRWSSWTWYTTLDMLADAIVTVIVARERGRTQPTKRQLTPLSVNEIDRLFARPIVSARHTIIHWLHLVPLDDSTKPNQHQPLPLRQQPQTSTHV